MDDQCFLWGCLCLVSRLSPLELRLCCRNELGFALCSVYLFHLHLQLDKHLHANKICQVKLDWL